MSNSDAMYDEAVQLKNQNNLEAAVSKLKEIVAQDPNHALSHSALAVYLQKLGRFPDAIEHAKRVADLEPNDPFSFTQLSVIYVRCGMVPEAEAARDRAHHLTGACGHHHH